MSTRTAFTLIELLVVISIIAILAAMLLPAIGLVKQASQASVCASNQRQIVMAVLGYTSEQDGMMPYSWGPVPGSAGPLSWCVADRLGQYMQIESTSVPWNATLGSSDIRMMQGSWKLLQCPSNVRQPTSGHYGLNTRFCSDNTDLSAGVPVYPVRSISRIGKSTTAAVVADDAGDSRWAGFWSNPVMIFGNGNIDQTPSWSNGYPYLQPFLVVPRHRKACNLGFLDGHVRNSPNIAIEDQAQTILLR